MIMLIILPQDSVAFDRHDGGLAALVFLTTPPTTGALIAFDYRRSGSGLVVPKTELVLHDNGVSSLNRSGKSAAATKPRICNNLLSISIRTGVSGGIIGLFFLAVLPSGIIHSTANQRCSQLVFLLSPPLNAFARDAMSFGHGMNAGQLGLLNNLQLVI